MKCKICLKEDCINHSLDDQREYEIVKKTRDIEKLTKSIDKYYKFRWTHYNHIPNSRELAMHLLQVYRIETI